MTAARHLDHGDVLARVDPAELEAALRQAFLDPPTVPSRSRTPLDGLDDATLLVMPAWRRGGRLGVKLATVFPQNGERGLAAVAAHYVVFSAVTGAVEATLDGRAITLLRTAAVSALAANALAAPSAGRLLIVGTGDLAPFLARAHVRGRDLRVSVWGRSPAKAIALADALEAGGLDAAAVVDLEAAAREADIVSCATLSKDPLVRGAWLKAGAHLDLVGGFRPAMREADDDALAGATCVGVDTRDALETCGDLLEPVRRGVLDPTRVRSLAELLAEGRSARGHGRTVFKSVGTALADLTCAELALR